MYNIAGIRGPIKWWQLPLAVQHEFLMNGTSQLIDHYIEAPNGAGHAGWSNTNIEKLMDLAEQRVGWREGFPCGYPMAPDDFYDSIDAYPVEGLSILVVGSETPWLEAILLGYGDAEEVVTVDFNPPPANDYIETVYIHDLSKSGRVFDAIATFSSIEHDGLGRYGDPINPNADILRMRALESLVSPGGLLFLGVPIGQDSLVWNAHRIYGERRFPLLTAGWEQKAIFGGEEEDLLAPVPDATYHFQPLWIMRRIGTAPDDKPKKLTTSAQ